MAASRAATASILRRRSRGARETATVPDPHRSCVAPCRWRRHCECGFDIHRQAHEGYRNAQERRGFGLADHGDLPRPIVLMSAIGIAIGLALGVAVPPIIDAFYGDLLPVRINVQVSPQSLGIAAFYGAIIALLFALWPLGRAENVRASVLFRDFVNSVGGRPRKGFLAIMACSRGPLRRSGADVGATIDRALRHGRARRHAGGVRMAWWLSLAPRGPAAAALGPELALRYATLLRQTA